MAPVRKIIHVDCDCFYASIEVRDNPQLAGLPLAVGGSPERRGVVATCNYEARRFGIHSAMAAATARRLCPGLVIIRPDMAKYRQASQQIHAILGDYTDLIEPLSLDEAYLDVTGSNHLDGSASRIASEIRQRVKAEVGITVSAGVAPNKFLAKIASDWDKPDGQFVISPEQVDDFVSSLPVRRLHGVGKVTAGRLQELGVATCEDLRHFPISELTRQFGSFGERLYNLCRGIDLRKVQPSRIRKSLSVENTYPADLPSLQSCRDAMEPLYEQLLKRLNPMLEEYRIVKQVVKIKFLDFVSTTVETGSHSTDREVYFELLDQGFARGERPVRLLGLGVRLTPRGEEPEPIATVKEASQCSKEKEIQLALGLE